MKGTTSHQGGEDLTVQARLQLALRHSLTKSTLSLHAAMQGSEYSQW